MTSIKRIPIDLIYTDGSYQRPVQIHYVKKLAEDWEQDLCGFPEVSHRADGRFYVFDGQHRIAALELRGATHVDCIVHSGLTVPQEAHRFVELNRKRRSPKPMFRFKAQVRAEDPMALDIKRIIESNGFVIRDEAKDPNSVVAIASMEQIYKMSGNPRGGPTQKGQYKGPALLDMSLKTVRRIWQNERGAVSGEFMRGLSAFLRDIGRPLTDNAVARLEQYTPLTIIRRARDKENRYYGGGGLVTAINQELSRISGMKPQRKARTAQEKAGKTRAQRHKEQVAAEQAARRTLG